MSELVKSQFSVRSTIVKSMIVDGKAVHRHFFEWYDRHDLNSCYLRLTLLQQNGETIGKTHSLKFPKAKQVGTVTVKEMLTETEKPHYDQSTYFYVDADQISAGFEYYTATIKRKASPKIDTISSKREDLTVFEK